jgi:5S rRNA maturation endonuclease (ribonuclease M5)
MSRPTGDTAYTRLLAALRAHGNTVNVNGHQAVAQCPAHNDQRPSLSMTPIEGRVLIYCHAGCATKDVVANLGLTMADLFDTRKGQTYRYSDGRRVHRSADKHFRQSGNTSGHALFHAELIGDAQTVYVVEGEQDVLALESVGAVAVCSAMGAGKAHLFDWAPLTGRHVTIVADKDAPGRKHAAQVADLLRPLAASVRTVEAKTGKDAADHIAAGHTPEEFTDTQPQHDATPAGVTGVTGLSGRGGDSAEDTPDGAELLDDIDAYLARFVVYPAEHDRHAHTLWIAHTWLMECWESTPRFAFLSPEPGSGKSRALEVTGELVPRAVHAVNTTPAYLFRKVSDPAGAPTILYDEIDTVFGPKAKDNEDIRGMLNAGHRKGAMAGRCVVRGKTVETEELPAYCAVMLAGLDDLPDTLMTRSVVVRMRRRAPSEPVEPWRHRVNAPQAQQLARQLCAWATSVRDRAEGMWPTMPEGVTDRDADKWEPLLAVAELAGGNWLRKAHVAAVTSVTASKASVPSVGVQLLEDIKAAFDGQHADHLPTDQLLTILINMQESPWSIIRRGEPLNALGLAQHLRKYGIKPGPQRIGEQVARGYARTQFTDAWSRYLSDKPVTPVTPEGQEPTQHNELRDETEPATASAPPPDKQRKGSRDPIRARAPDQFANYPTCIFCDAPVAAGQTNTHGQPAHYSCQQTGSA